MAESEAIQTAITQVAIQLVTAAVMALREAETGPASGSSTANAEEVHRPRYGGPTLPQWSFNWKTPNKYVGLLNFEMDVTNTLQTRIYELHDEEKVSYYKKTG